MKLKNIYGKMIIKKGSILYHTSYEEFKPNPDKAMLFCIFHPSEWNRYAPYITFIKLKRDIKLLFMVDKIIKDRVLSSLNSFTNNKNGIMIKRHNNILKLFAIKLKKERFDGWFTSIEDKTTVEVALINNENIFDIVKTEELKRNWRNGNCANKNNTKIPKNWGYLYPISTIKRPVKIKMNLRYKKMIEEYKKFGKNSGYPFEYIFQVLLENAKIFYYKEDFTEIT
jgi:hypothetical protein